MRWGVEGERAALNRGGASASDPKRTYDQSALPQFASFVPHAPDCPDEATKILRFLHNLSIRISWKLTCVSPQDVSIALFATRWGSQKGGLNALNTALCLSLSKRLKRQILCVVEQATEAERQDALANNVLLESIKRPFSLSEDVLRAVTDLAGQRQIDVKFWIGHDVWTGPVAVAMAKRVSARSVVIHHMDFESYAPLKHSDIEAEERGKRQRKLLRSADTVFGVGPILTESAKKHGATAYQLSPGIPDIPHRERSVGAFEILIIGRISREDDPIKQAKLAVAAVTKASNTKGFERADWRVKVIGCDPVQSETQYLESLRSIAAGGRAYLQLRILPFNETQAELFDTIAHSDLVLMPSMREGFGLVGWEAIGAGVPVIIGTKSGLYRHLEDLGFAGMVHGIDIRGRNAVRGDPDPNDVTALATLVERVFRERQAYKQQALSLRGALRNLPQTRWETTANQFLETIGLSRQPTQRRLEDKKVHGNDFDSIAALVKSNEWDGESLHKFVSKIDIDQVYICEKLSRILHSSIHTQTSLQQLGALHYALCRVGHTPLREDFFAAAGRCVGSQESIGIKLVDIPGGEFSAGSPADEPGRCEDEGPGPLMAVDRFKISQTTITNRQFRFLEPARNAYRWVNVDEQKLLSHPVVSVNWWEAYLFCIWVGGRLPTEVEWEFACRAGTRTAFYGGAILSCPTINAINGYDDRTGAQNRTLAADSETVPHPFDLRHMHGNVWEWCWDEYDSDGYHCSRPRRCAYAAHPVQKVARGGSWDTPAHACRSAFRNRYRPNYCNNDLGFRLVIPV
jgi:formylglycine-generating enzyme required for sulfatase activity/glycosyltransferase involved in cell wall biosynthesis